MVAANPALYAGFIWGVELGFVPLGALSGLISPVNGLFGFGYIMLSEVNYMLMR